MSQWVIRFLARDHRKDIAEFKKEAKVNNGPAGNYAKASLPTLEKHLQLAEALERRPSG